MNAEVFEIREELSIGMLNAVRFRVVRIEDSLILEQDQVVSVVYLKCLPMGHPVLDPDQLDKWGITPGTIMDLLRMKKDMIIERFLPLSLPKKVFWKMSILEGHDIIQVGITVGHGKTVLSV